MIGWSAINPVLIELFTALALPAGEDWLQWSAEWKDRNIAATNTRHRQMLYLKVMTVVGIGEDDRRLVYVTPGTTGVDAPYADNLQETIYGLRRVTLNLRSHVTENSDDVSATAVLERIRTRLARRRSIDTLMGVNVDIVRIEAARDISKAYDKRIQSIATMDVILTMVASDMDPIPTGWVQSLVLTSAIQDTSGATLPSPPNFTKTISS